MASPIEMIRGSERQTVYSDSKANALVTDGWQRVRDLPLDKQRALADLPPAPWKGYDDLTVEEVLAKSEGLPPERIQEVIRYESATKGRVSIVNKLTGNTANKGTWAEPTPPVTTTEQPPVTVETVKEDELKTVETVEIKSASEVPAVKGGKGE